MSERQSQFQIYSLGIVIAAKTRGSDIIEVTPIEAIPLQSGSLSEQSISHEANSTDAKGINRTSGVKGGTHITAKWIPFGHSNRITAPDVAAGETVTIFRFGDTDEYYWTTMFREPSLRKLETVNYAFSAQPGAGSFNKSSSYYAEVSTHDRYIQIHTSMSNGEPYGYDIKIDAANGSLSIVDTIGNSISLNSASSTIDVAANTAVNITSPTVTIQATNVNIKGALAVDGAITGTGDITVTGAVHGNNI